jgi:hypothetical protein
MGLLARVGKVACIAFPLAFCPPPTAIAVPLSPDELAGACAQADGPAHCARRIEEIQLKRLPHLATREGESLKVSLYPTGVAAFTDTEALDGGRTFALWDFVSEINAVVLFATDGGNAFFVLLQRTNGRRFELPAEPRVSPDRTRLVTADFCASNCINELVVWRVTKDGVQKELAWKPPQAWDDAGAAWRDSGTIAVEYTASGAAAPSTLIRRLTDADWRRFDTP